MSRKKIKILFTGLCAIISSAAHAFPAENSGYVSLFGGAGWTKSGETTDVTLEPPITTNRYEASTAAPAAPIVGLSTGYVWRSLGRLALNLSLGLESQYTRVLSAAGTVRPLFFINPNFDTLNFRYAVSSVPLLVVSTLQFPGERWIPYIIGGIGFAWNKTSNYYEEPSDPNNSALPMRSPFTPRGLIEFAYTVGGGLSYSLSALASIALEYRYTNYGDAQFNPPSQEPNATRFSLGQVASNALLLRFSMGFGKGLSHLPSVQ